MLVVIYLRQNLIKKKSVRVIITNLTLVSVSQKELNNRDLKVFHLNKANA